MGYDIPKAMVNTMCISDLDPTLVKEQDDWVTFEQFQSEKHFEGRLKPIAK